MRPEFSEPRLRAAGLAKAFGATQALRSCSLSVTAGEVHTVVGENGSGKSTLVKILTGVLQPDAGTIEIAGRSKTGLRHPREAIAAGIVGVFQNVLIVGPQSVLDNVWLGSDGVVRARVGGDVRRARAEELLTELLDVPPDLDAPAETLSLSERQTCAVARALLREPDLLVLDEATSALDVATRDRLFARLRRLADAGRSVVFISHRMDEVEEISDSITVLRAGESVATVRRGEASSGELVRLMTGVEHAPARRATRPVDARTAIAAPFDVTIRAGELLGVAGLEGHGQEPFLRALAGARSAGVAYVPRDRQTAAVFESLSIRDNFALPTLGEDRRLGLLSGAKTARRFAAYVERLRINVGDARDEITTLSGGNQQKVLLARWLAVQPRVLVLNDPTRGIDPGAKRDLYELLGELAGEGVAVVMLSTDLDELVEIMDRVLVFREGTLFDELAGPSLTREMLVARFFGRR